MYENERYTFGESLRQFLAVGAELSAGVGVKQGDRVGIAMRNYPEFLIAFLAITAMQAQNITPILVRGDAATAAKHEALLWGEVLARKSIGIYPTLDLQPEDEAMSMHTPGSTGFSKGGCHTRDRERQRETERDRERQRETERDRERQRETERDCDEGW